MGIRKGWGAAAVLGLAAIALLWGALSDDPVMTAMETIRAADMKSDLYFLASDEMQGRDTNTPFNEIASRYLAHRFESLGLEGAGDDDSYFHYFSLLEAQLSDPNHLEIVRSGSPLITTGLLKEDFYPSPLTANAKVEAAVVFAGYGITAPEHGYDDYAGLEAGGKVVLVMSHEPAEEDADSSFDGQVASDYGRELHKILNAQAHGAVGLIMVQDPAHHPGPEHFAREARSLWPEKVTRPRYSLEMWAEKVTIPAVYASRRIANLLMSGVEGGLEGVQKEIDRASQPNSFPLAQFTARLQTAVVRNPVRVRNVLASISGTDPVLKNEVVIVGAHFDHVGAREGEIYNGADDDGSGTVGLLEVAEAFARNREKPKRSVLFAAWNAEERGLLGSYYYVERPAFPLHKTVAMFQMDMIGRNEEVPDPKSRRFRGLEKQSAEENANTVNILGYSRSEDLRRLAIQHNGGLGLELKFRYDNHPQNLLRRSDNWPFLNRNVPALFFHTGLHPDYHTPRDTPDKINYAKMEKIVRLVFLCAWATAHTPTPPRLNPRK